MYRKSVTGIRKYALNCICYNKQNTNFKNLNKMKKMIFSAIALVAFSFAGMANEIEDERVETKKIENEPQDCNSMRQIMYLAYIGAGYGHSAASAESYAYYFGCMANNPPFKKELFAN
jgi:hypothetical protein